MSSGIFYVGILKRFVIGGGYLRQTKNTVNVLHNNQYRYYR